MQKLPNILGFLGFFKTLFLAKVCYCYFVGNFCEKNGLLLFQYLVTLVTVSVTLHTTLTNSYEFGHTVTRPQEGRNQMAQPFLPL